MLFISLLFFDLLSCLIVLPVVVFSHDFQSFIRDSNHVQRGSLIKGSHQWNSIFFKTTRSNRQTTTKNKIQQYSNIHIEHKTHTNTTDLLSLSLHPVHIDPNTSQYFEIVVSIFIHLVVPSSQLFFSS